MEVLKKLQDKKEKSEVKLVMNIEIINLHEQPLLSKLETFTKFGISLDSSNE